MDIVNPMNRSANSVNDTSCHCMCDNGSAYWKARGATYSNHCGCQCIEGNGDNAASNYSTAMAAARA